MESSTDPRQRWLELANAAVRDGGFLRLTLSDPCGPDATLKKVLVRPVTVAAGPRLSFVYRHATRDVTRNFPFDEGLAQIESLLGSQFRDAHLGTTARTARLRIKAGGKSRLALGPPSDVKVPGTQHDRPRNRLVDPRQAAWLHGLGVTDSEGRVARGMEAKFRQIQRFVEILQHLLGAGPDARAAGSQDGGHATAPLPLTLVDMGCGKGYLTFAAYEFLRRSRSGDRSPSVWGIESRPDLVDLANRVAAANGFDGLHFHAGSIETSALDRVEILVALHACDTATDDAIAKGIRAGASLILVAPCCHKELRPALRPPPVLAPALRHGILLERHAEFVTDALRAALLEWAGYDTKVFEFVSPEHTARNLMIAAVRRTRPADVQARARQVRELAAFYGIRSQRLAGRLGFALEPA